MKETYKTIKDYPNYEVSNFGNVHNKKTGKVLKPIRNKQGYQHVGLPTNGKPKFYLIHRLVASAFIPNPEHKRTVNHLDGDKTNNRAENLEWCDDGENQKHAYRTDLKHPSGGSPKQRVRCIETGQIFESLRQTSEYFNCGVANIHCSIHTGCRCKGFHFELIPT